MTDGKSPPGSRPGPSSRTASDLILVIACLVIIATYVLMVDLKGINTDEGMRLAIINGGNGYTASGPAVTATWSEVVRMNAHCAYQPLYFLIQNTLMRVAGTHDVVFVRLVNIFFLWLCLQGLLALSRAWALLPRLFLLGLFSFNAYLFMHVLQIREYTAGLAFYIWSSWLVLRLDRKKLDRPWTDSAEFAAYGALLVTGFYLQTWVVFPAIGQALFLLVRRSADRWRFHAHLAISYGIALAGTLPYVLANHQKVDVGRWGTTTSKLAPQLSTGFHLVFAGHVPGQSPFTDFLFWLWPLLIVVAAVLLVRKKGISLSGDIIPETRRSAFLMLLCVGVSLAFQVGYFYAREDLSVWPRYFIIHYFFATWLVALAFRFLDEWRHQAPAGWTRRSLGLGVGALGAVLAISAISQTRSYHRDPYLDTGFTQASNWRVWTRQLSRVMQPGDVVVFHDYVSRATMTFTLPMTNRQFLLDELEDADLHEAPRALYLGSSSFPSERGKLETALLGHGFSKLEEIRLFSADGQTMLPEPRILVFSRD